MYYFMIKCEKHEIYLVKFYGSCSCKSEVSDHHMVEMKVKLKCHFLCHTDVLLPHL